MDTTTLAPGDKVINNKGGDSFFGKVMKFIKREGESILLEIEVEGKKIEAWLHHSQVKPVPKTIDASATSAPVQKQAATTVTPPPPVK